MIYLINYCFIFLTIFEFANCQEKYPPYLTQEDFDRAKILPGNQEIIQPFNVQADYLEKEYNNLTRNVDRSYKPWPLGRVPYTIMPNLNENDRAEIAKSFKNFEEKTCVRFVPKTSSDVDHIYIERDDSLAGWAGGMAQLCRVGGPQFVKLYWRAALLITHELMHSLCFNHEHGRADRDLYLDTSGCNIEKFDGPQDDTLDLFYDYLSAMHYPCDACLRPKQQGATHCWGDENGTLSIIDVEKINKLYDCPGCHSYRFIKWSKASAKDIESLVYGGNENGVLTVPCRAYHNGDIIPGKSYLGSNGLPTSCIISHNMIEYNKEDFEFLTNPSKANFKWTLLAVYSYTEQGFRDFKAVPIGRRATRESLFMGRCKITIDGVELLLSGHVETGGSMWASYKGKVHYCRVYEVLTCDDNLKPPVNSGQLDLVGRVAKEFYWTVPKNGKAMTQTQATQFCLDNGMKLATIRSKEEQGIIQSIGVGKKIDGNQGYNFWISSKMDTDKIWRWADGSGIGFNKWHQGWGPQPSGSADNSCSYCSPTYWASGGWFDFPCELASPLPLCEKITTQYFGQGF